MAEPSERPWDVILLGATGFTGQLVAEHLLRTQPQLRWAIAGRDAYRLRDVKMGLVGMDRRAGEIGTHVVELHDTQAMAELAASTRVLVTTVGPYSQHGAPVVAAAVGAGTHYLDITGEPAFVNDIRRRHGREARERGIKVVSCCGFDSIPADLGARFTVQQLAGGPKRVCAYLRVKASPSGGTWASLIEALSGSGTPGQLRRPGTRPPRLHRAPEEAGGGWALPMPVIDLSVVRRTAAAQPELYGEDFVYGQYLRIRSRTRAARLIAGLATMSTIARVPGGKRWLKARLPSGDGPGEAERGRSFFELTFVGQGADQRVITRISGGDPGYTETSRMLATTAGLLARQPDRLPDAVGVLTPALAFGDVLRERLIEQGLSFEVLSDSAA